MRCTFLCFTFPLLFVVACGDLKSSTPGGDGNAGDGGPGSATLPSTAGPNGGGELGALPTGYCCTDDSECRYRHCATTSAGKMCLDACHGTGVCDRTEGVFTCDEREGQDPNVQNYCQPAAGFTCIDPKTFIHGTRASGECCDGLGSSDNGDECAGGHCTSVTLSSLPTENPYVCSQWCRSTKDCPSGMICDELHTCEPGNQPYTCK